jgi:hypothetical protein
VRGYVRVRGIWRSRATRRRSRRAASRHIVRRTARTTRSIMVTRPIAGIVPATHPWFRCNLVGRAIFALSTGLPTLGGAMLDQPAA